MQLMKDLHQLVDYIVPLYFDNQSAISLAKNPVLHARTKHLEVHYHFIKEKILQYEVKIRYVKTNDQVTNLFTKRLGTKMSNEFRQQLSTN